MEFAFEAAFSIVLSWQILNYSYILQGKKQLNV